VIAIAERVGDLDIAALDLAAPKRIVELTATH
jgi:hypothetical protein